MDASATKRTRAVNLLEQAGAVATTDGGRLEYVDPDLTADQAVERAVDAAETHQRLIQSRIQMMRGYAETTDCRRHYLLGYFGEQMPHPCGNCDTCEAGTAEEQPAGNGEFPLSSSVHHGEWGPWDRDVGRTGPTDRAVRWRRLQDAVHAGGPGVQEHDLLSSDSAS